MSRIIEEFPHFSDRFVFHSTVVLCLIGFIFG